MTVVDEHFALGDLESRVVDRPGMVGFLHLELKYLLEKIECKHQGNQGNRSGLIRGIQKVKLKSSSGHGM